MQPKTLDHVAFWVADRDAIAATLTSRLGVHEIDRQDNFTLLGADARRFKLTLFDAEGPRQPGPFAHVALRVSDLAAARAALPEGTPEIFDRSWQSVVPLGTVMPLQRFGCRLPN